MAVIGLRKVISDYLDRSISLGEFASGFARLSYGIRESGDPNVVYLCYAIESRIAEVHLKLIPEDGFRNAIAVYSEADVFAEPIVMMSSLVVVNTTSSNLLSSRPAGEIKRFDFELCLA